MKKGTIVASFAVGAALAFGTVTLLQTENGAPLYKAIVPDFGDEAAKTDEETLPDRAADGSQTTAAEDEAAAGSQADDTIQDPATPVDDTADIAVTDEKTEAGTADTAKLATEEQDGETADAVQLRDTRSSVLQSPSFDIVRVERDGSTVIAGRAPADSEVELVTGDRVIARTVANRSGEFAIVLDEPFAAGDHEITIRARPPEGVPLVSQETVVVSLTPDQAQETLVIVSKEGAASRILQGPGERTALVAPSADQQEEPDTATSEPQEPTAQSSEGTQAEDKDAQVAAIQDDAATDPTEQEIEDQPRDTPPSQAVEETEPGAAVPVLVRAIDVEPNRIFIAGSGAPGTAVRIYINGAFKGETEIAPNGAFLSEIAEALEPGRHDLRADLVNKAGTVVSRAQVFVDHLPQLALAEPQSGRETAADTAPVTDTVTDDDTAQLGLAPQTGQPQIDADGVAATDSTSQSDMTRPADEEINEPAETAALGTPNQSAAENIEADASAGDDGETASVEASSVAPRSDDTETEPTAPTGTQATPAQEISEEAIEDAAGDEAAETAERTPSKSADAASKAMAKAEQDEAEKMAEQEGDKARPVLQTGRSVIIRRGDNLWRVSRRMFGAGRKYTLIFEANSDQIRDPALIYPGQVLGIPEDPEAEKNSAAQHPAKQG